MSNLPNDLTRCVPTDCPDKERCLRYTDRPASGVTICEDLSRYRKNGNCIFKRT
jgi:hypothetical protein